MKQSIVSRPPFIPIRRGSLIPLQTALTPYLHGDQLNRTARELMDELRTDCKNCEQRSIWWRIVLTLLKAQEVTTILRDRLTTLSSDLIEARSRISDLEGILAQDRQAIGNLSAELAVSSKLEPFDYLELGFSFDLDEGTRGLSEEVKAMAKELRDANSNAAELEIELANAQERCVPTSRRPRTGLMVVAGLKGLRENSQSPRRTPPRFLDFEKRKDINQSGVFRGG